MNNKIILKIPNSMVRHRLWISELILNRVYDSFEIIIEKRDIEFFIKKIIDSDAISIDIEFMRRNTYFPEPCVMQISNGKIHTCIDLALEIDYKELLCEIFFSNKLIPVPDGMAPVIPTILVSCSACLIRVSAKTFV